MAQAESVIKAVVEHLSMFEGVAALVLAGSRVKGNKFPPDEFSDIELYVVSLDEQFDKIQKEVQLVQDIFDKDSVILAYKNQWAGWSILFENLLRLELPLVKASDEKVFSRSDEQKIELLYVKPGFKLKTYHNTSSELEKDMAKELDHAIKDFWYMAIYAAQHIGRGELWLARDAIRISMQGKVKNLLQEQNYKDTLNLDRDRRLELTWNQEELTILKETSSSYDKLDIIRAFKMNIKYAEVLLTKLSKENLFQEYKNRLMPRIERVLLKKD